MQRNWTLALLPPNGRAWMGQAGDGWHAAERHVQEPRRLPLAVVPEHLADKHAHPKWNQTETLSSICILLLPTQMEPATLAVPDGDGHFRVYVDGRCFSWRTDNVNLAMDLSDADLYIVRIIHNSRGKAMLDIVDAHTCAAVMRAEVNPWHHRNVQAWVRDTDED